MIFPRYNKRLCSFSLVLMASVPLYSFADSAAQTSEETEVSVEKFLIWGEVGKVKKSHNVSATSQLTVEDMVSINATTTEDLVSYEPGLIIRKRFIGDSNGTVGMRGSNMFQTSRAMVFADGVPLHYFLQTRWSGAPRWSLVSADEIAQVDIIYGPYSAEYGGNSMGGVINIETAIPTERKFHFEGTLFSHGFEEQGFDRNLNGNKSFFSYADKIDNLTIYTSINHLENKGHPQTFRFAKPVSETVGAPIIEGAINGVNEYGDEVFYYGDSGITDVTTNNYKVKIGYEFDNWIALLNITYEDRQNTSNHANNYLTSESGVPVWNGGVNQDGTEFSVRESHFAESELERNSLLIGLRLQGELNDQWFLETNLSSFKVLKDETRSSNSNSESPAYSSAGEVREYDDTGWSTTEIKLQNDEFLSNNTLSFVTGFRYENYQLIINNYDSDNYLSGEKTTLDSSSGGDTSIEALYAQLAWQINSKWDSVFGGRYESWSSDNGFYKEQVHPNRSEKRFSPKFSVGYQLNDWWQLRYSNAKAFRFPIVEELFQNERRTQGTSLADANLEPEDGLHHNLMLQKKLENGMIRVNYFAEEIEEVIFAQRTIVDNQSINTFIPIDLVETKGIEFVYNQFALFDGNLDLRFNATYTDSKIAKNRANTLLEGKVFPRMPKWRSNVLATYHLTDAWKLGGGIRYASNSFGDLDNQDVASNVFGAHDGYTLLNLKTSYQLNQNTKLSFGVDNVTGKSVYVHHPWPQRTFYLDVSIDY